MVSERDLHSRSSSDFLRGRIRKISFSSNHILFLVYFYFLAGLEDFHMFSVFFFFFVFVFFYVTGVLGGGRRNAMVALKRFHIFYINSLNKVHFLYKGCPVTFYYYHGL